MKSKAADAVSIFPRECLGEPDQNGVGSMNRRTTFSVRRETLFRWSAHESAPAHAMDPVEKTAPPSGVSKKTMSHRTLGQVSPVIAACVCVISSLTQW